MPGARSNVVSSFTIIKGSLIEETHRAFQIWDLDLSKKENLDRMKADNVFGGTSAGWLRDVAKVINRRFDPSNRDLALVELAQGGYDLEDWRPILLWHLTRDEFLLRDFLSTWLYQAHKDGSYRIQSEDVEPYLRKLSLKKVEVAEEWSEPTLKRVASGLLRIATDFGLLKGGAMREFARYHLPDDAFIYILHAMTDEGLAPRELINSNDWHIYFMDASDVERELLRLHQFGHLEYQTAGSLVRLELPETSVLEYARSLIR